MHDPLCMSWSQPKCNSDEAYSTQENEVLCQNGLWSFARLPPKHVPLGNLRNAPRQFRGMSDVVLELLGTVWSPWQTVPNGSLPIALTITLYRTQWQRICRWCLTMGNVTHIWTQRSTRANASQSPSMGARCPHHWRCPKFTQDYLLCCQLELLKEWSACHEDYKRRSQHCHQYDPRQWQNSHNANHTSRSHYWPSNLRSTTSILRRRQNGVSVSTTRGYQTQALPPTSTIKSGKYPNRIHYNDPTKIQLPLGAMSFTEKECSSIQAKYMPTVLSKMGINRSMPTEVCSGPALYAGMSVSKLWPLQGSTKNKLLIGHLRKSDIVGTNLQVELDRSLVGHIK